MLPLILRLFVMPQQPEDKHPPFCFLAFEISYGDGEEVVLLFAIMSHNAEPSSTEMECQNHNNFLYPIL